jgi:N-carbamoyl-L-amino-acid hydrolase
MNVSNGPTRKNHNPGIAAAEAVDQDRLWQRHMEMAKIGAIPGNGVNRQALTKEDITARKLFFSWAKASGFSIGLDAIGNIFVRRHGRDPDAAPVVTGSHMDSQLSGGRFDGIYGVLAGLEVLEALNRAGAETERPIDVVAWTNEEGGRFAPGAMGSMVFTESRPLEECLGVVDPQGVVFADALAETLAATPEAEKRPFNFPIAAYIETHIEQGPVLEAKGLPVGVVTSIQGSRWFEIEIRGESAHAGTTPLNARRDAVQGAVAAISALNTLMDDPTDTVRFTVGRMIVVPNSPNTVASRVSFTIDLRHPESTVLTDLGDKVEAACRRAVTCCDVEVREVFNRQPCVFDPNVLATIEGSAAALNLPTMRMPSGAFHDAMFMNEICPSGMIFVPCEKGVSHNPAENASPGDLAAGVRVLAMTVFKLANS